ncbi:MAG: hypothetical protein ACFB15_27535 [Cyclobacteriaceae bacterium]
MSTTENNLRDKIINRISSLAQDKLQNVDEYIDMLEGTEKCKQKILSSAGIWKDMDDDTFQSLTVHLHANRQQGSKRIYG